MVSHNQVSRCTISQVSAHGPNTPPTNNSSPTVPQLTPTLFLLVLGQVGHVLGKGQGTSRGAGPREGSGREGAASRPTSGTPGCVLSVHNRQALARTGSWFFPISFCACACRSQITAAGKISHAALPPCVPACLRACVSPPFPCPHALCIMHHARTSHSDSVGLTESPEQHSTLTGAHSPHSPLVAQWCTALPPSARATPSSHRTSHCCSSHCCFTADDGLARERRGRNWG